MAMNLGLESLVDQPVINVDAESVSYEDLSTVLEFSETGNECLLICNDLAGVITAIENISAVSEVVEKHGVTDALKDLIGENFKTDDISTEAAQAKEGLWARFIKFLKELWAKIKAFFAQFFVSAKKMAAALRARAGELRRGKMVEVTVKLPGADIIKTIYEVVKAKFPEVIAELKKQIENMKKGKTPDGEDTGSSTLKVLLAREATVLEQGLKTYENPENVKIAKEAACQTMEMVAGVLDAISLLKNGVDSIETLLTAMSSNINASNLSAKVGDDVRKNTKDDLGENASAAVGKQVTKGIDALGSDEARKQIAAASYWITKHLNRISRKTVAYGSLCLSTFKVAKGE